jgi:flagellar biosynthesis/type III secretory pathway protein FliH
MSERAGAAHQGGHAVHGPGQGQRRRGGAQQRIVDIVRRLEEAGDVVIEGRGGETGSEQARVQATNDLGTLLQGWSAALESFEADRDAMLSAARTEMVELAAEIASRVTRRVIELDASVVNAQMEAVLLAVARPSKLLVRVNPADLQRAGADLPGLLERFERCRHADLIGDATLEPGSCVATTEDGGRIDAAIDTQLARILAELLPADTSASSTRQPRIDAA